MFSALLFVVSLAPQDPGAASRAAEPLPAIEDFAGEFARVLPGEAELAWRGVPWLSEFRRGLVLASEQDKPVLLWAMNGHPLGQT
ncbi:MAG: hypothetical protein NXI31_21070 [bacterium]|nr:hypothetical protein [bacterium]